MAQREKSEREKRVFWILGLLDSWLLLPFLGLFRAETALEPSEKFFNFSALFY